MKNFLLINFFLFNFVFFIVPAVSWEVNNTSNLSESCINENLDPCSSIKNSVKKKVDLEKKIKKEKKIVKEKNKIELMKRVVEQKEPTKVKKKIVNKKQFTLISSSNKSNNNHNFDKEISFNDFKALLIDYGNNADYPVLDK